MKKRILLPLAMIIGIVAGIIMIPVIMVGAGYYLVVRDPIRNSSAVAVLSGGGIERLDHAVKLLDDRFARRLILTNTSQVDPQTGTRMSKVMMDQASQRGVRKVNIYITGGESATTREEAIAIKSLMDERDWKSLIVVTDSFHSRRTKIIFQDVFKGSGVKISVNPIDAPDYWYKPAAWWKNPDSRRATIYEYVSLIYNWLGLYEK
jgi:uncharacterized SAM-binding protein YcdF (DUF218 family)